MDFRVAENLDINDRVQQTLKTVRCKKWLDLLAHKAYVNFSLNIFPLLYCTQRGKQFVESRFLSGLILKPGKEIERLILREISTVMKSSC